MAQSDLRLNDLLSRNLAIEWFEGVALIQTVCRIVGEQDSGAGGFPAAADILLKPAGDVTVLRLGSAEDGAAAAARLLAQMARETCPVQLRLLMSQATATQAGTAPLAEFSKALTFFERPAPDEILRQLYLRASAAPALQPQPAASRENEQQRHESDAPARTEKKRKRPFPWALAAALVCVAAGSFVVFGLQRHRVSAAAGTLQTAVLDRFGLKAATPSDEPVEKAKAEKASNSVRSPASRSPSRAPRERASVRTDATAPFALTPLPFVNRGAMRPMPLLPDRIVDVYAEREHPEPTAEDIANRVYSVNDPDVTPPRAVYPRFPTTPPGTVTRPDHTVIDLIIAEDGTVERARLRTVPRNVIEIMLLSAAKAWRFQPARVEGVPVRFRHYVVVTPEMAAGQLTGQLY